MHGNNRSEEEDWADVVAFFTMKEKYSKSPIFLACHLSFDSTGMQLKQAGGYSTSLFRLLHQFHIESSRKLPSSCKQVIEYHNQTENTVLSFESPKF